MRKALSVLILLSAAVLVMESGCSSGGPAASGGGNESLSGAAYSGPHACAVLTAALARSVVGAGAQLTQNTKPSQFVTRCQYRSKLGNVSVETGMWKWLKPMSSATPVPGMGDEASINPMGLFVRKGDRGLKVLVAITGTFSGAAADSDTAHEFQLEKQLAPKLLSKL